MMGPNTDRIKPKTLLNPEIADVMVKLNDSNLIQALFAFEAETKSFRETEGGLSE